MKTSKLVILSILFMLSTASAIFAADDGNTKPRLSGASAFPSTSAQDIISTTSGSGNIKGVSCAIYYNTTAASVIFTVNGAATQTIDVTSCAVPDADGYNRTGWIPMNIRFTSSIRVQVQASGGTGQVTCFVSWALD